jgi:hypothetical protein
MVQFEPIARGRHVLPTDGRDSPRAEVPEALWAQARGSGFAAPDDLWRIAPNIAVRVICTGPPCGARVLNHSGAAGITARFFAV